MKSSRGTVICLHTILHTWPRRLRGGHCFYGWHAVVMSRYMQHLNSRLCHCYQRTTCNSSVLKQAGLLACFLRSFQLMGGNGITSVHWELFITRCKKNTFGSFSNWMSLCIGDSGQVLLSPNAVWLVGTTAMLIWWSYQVYSTGQKKKMYLWLSNLHKPNNLLVVWM